MGILLWIVIGLIVSILTLVIEPYIIRQHIIITIFLGVLGAVIGGALGTFLGFDETEGMRFIVVLFSAGVSAFILTWYRALEKYFS